MSEQDDSSYAAFDRAWRSVVPIEKFRNPPSIVAVIPLSGVIGSIGPMRRGMSLSALGGIIERAFRLPRLKAVALAINSPGGSVTDGLAIYDTMQHIKSPVSTICVGLAASMGALLLTAGEPGQRFALPNSEMLIHQVMGGASGQASDVKIKAEQILKLKSRLNKILQQHTKQALSKIEKDADRDYYMTAEEAVKYGLVDKVVK